jgi:hypothetical protein
MLCFSTRLSGGRDWAIVRIEGSTVLRKRVRRAVLASEMRTIALAFREQSRGKRIATAREELAATRRSLLEMIREMRTPTALPARVRPDRHVLVQQPT